MILGYAKSGGGVLGAVPKEYHFKDNKGIFSVINDTTVKHNTTRLSDKKLSVSSLEVSLALSLLSSATSLIAMAVLVFKLLNTACVPKLKKVIAHKKV